MNAGVPQVLGPAAGGGIESWRDDEPDAEAVAHDCMDGDGAIGVSGVKTAEAGDGGMEPRGRRVTLALPFPLFFERM